MSEQNAVRNELSLAQENAALRSRVARNGFNIPLYIPSKKNGKSGKKS